MRKLIPVGADNSNFYSLFLKVWWLDATLYDLLYFYRLRHTGTIIKYKS
jgi:hypothetical protein